MVANEAEAKPNPYYLFTTDTVVTITSRSKVPLSEREIVKLGILIRVGTIMNIFHTQSVGLRRDGVAQTSELCDIISKMSLPRTLALFCL
jgi:hypothetical protein